MKTAGPHTPFIGQTRCVEGSNTVTQLSNTVTQLSEGEQRLLTSKFVTAFFGSAGSAAPVGDI